MIIATHTVKKFGFEFAFELLNDPDYLDSPLMDTWKEVDADTEGAIKSKSGFFYINTEYSVEDLTSDYVEEFGEGAEFVAYKSLADELDYALGSFVGYAYVEVWVNHVNLSRDYVDNVIYNPHYDNLKEVLKKLVEERFDFEINASKAHDKVMEIYNHVQGAKNDNNKE